MDLNTFLDIVTGFAKQLIYFTCPKITYNPSGYTYLPIAANANPNPFADPIKLGSTELFSRMLMEMNSPVMKIRISTVCVHISTHINDLK